MATNQQFVKGLNNLMREAWLDIQRTSRKAQAAAAKRNPNRHAATLVMAEGKSTKTYHFAGAWRSANILVRWGYTVHRNAAGRFLAYRETIRHKTVKDSRGRPYKRPIEARRDQFRPFLSKISAVNAARESDQAERAKWNARRGARQAR